MKINELPQPNSLDKDSIYFLINEEYYDQVNNKAHAKTYKQSYNDMYTIIKNNLHTEHFVRIDQSIFAYNNGQCAIINPNSSAPTLSASICDLIQYNIKGDLVAVGESQPLIASKRIGELSNNYDLVFYDKTANQFVIMETSDQGATWRDSIRINANTN